ncbi:MAG: Trm112 family protein [Rhodanobacteraceae bacterium]
MDKRLLEILCCPMTKVPVRPLTRIELEALNQAIAHGTVCNGAGRKLDRGIGAGLVTRDGKTVYRIEDDIPVMLADEAIASTQVDGFSGI